MTTASLSSTLDDRFVASHLFPPTFLLVACSRNPNASDFIVSRIHRGRLIKFRRATILLTTPSMRALQIRDISDSRRKKVDFQNDRTVTQKTLPPYPNRQPQNILFH
ncbi:hypothetical protein QMA69_15930 [Burkholderia pseudomallei]|uniref:hypothetical protein n=1 Tax=Burkholderia pseudomallei TaxID=28450 RepID=UPI002DBC34EF|nr:hypothetical protein [Burkholderia pseudomallei]MEB5486518.1 hypothetical protein [Burkholderia pseudomallei]MEB5499842.1 hypothetical protein [Burkholderia pseudomallei]MEB5504830.1 hypothetical protein [Burkholderia pseudomallei]MEB5512585.1 hypothetical protein [Burkholderia pseudomallei]